MWGKFGEIKCEICETINYKKKLKEKDKLRSFIILLKFGKCVLIKFEVVREM